MPLRLMLALFLFLSPSVRASRGQPAPVNQCDLFGYNSVCDLTLSNIVDAILHLEDEIQCQSFCRGHPDCSYFSWLKVKSGISKCFLLDSCNSPTECAGDCVTSFSGPPGPGLKEACCTAFSDRICEYEHEVIHSV